MYKYRQENYTVYIRITIIINDAFNSVAKLIECISCICETFFYVKYCIKIANF